MPNYHATHKMKIRHKRFYSGQTGADSQKRYVLRGKQIQPKHRK